MLKQKLYDWKDQRAKALEEAREAVARQDMDTYKRKMADVEKLNGEIDAYKALLAEEGRFEEEDTAMKALHLSLKKEREEEARMGRVDQARSGNEYARAFSTALREGVRVGKGMERDELKPLYKALTESGGTPAGSDGGFLVPLDFDNMIHRLEREQMDLSQFFRVETVNTLSGWRAVESAPWGKALPMVDELGTIGKTDQPKFTKVTYSVKKYGDRLPVSRELMEDNTAGLMAYLAGWFAPRYVATKNALLLGLLDTLPAVVIPAGKELAELKRALNTALPAAVSRGAVLLTNQSGYDALDQMVDGQKRPMLQPAPADGDFETFKRRRVAFYDDTELGNGEDGEAGAVAPLYMGKFSAYATLFSRKALEFAATDVGGDAWASDGYELRGICRMDAQVMDGKAAVKRLLTLAQ